MLSVGFIYFIFLYVDIRLHVRKAKAAIKERQRRQQLYQDHLNQLNDVNFYLKYLFAYINFFKCLFI